MVDRADNFIASLGVEAYRVGGSVRDEILGRRVKDADYMVRGIGLDELAARVREAGAKSSPLKLRDGRQAGVRAEQKGMGLVEIVLPRTEVSTGPGHRDFEIVVDPEISLTEDARRRDFTFNALYKLVNHPGGMRVLMAMPDGSPVENIVDPTGRGLFDLSRGLIQTTHADSFRDDPLRTLRALRFVARGFTLATDTRSQMERHADAVTGLSANGYASGTVLDELGKILMGDCVADALRIARDTGVLGTLLPELAPMLGFDQGSRYHDMTTDEHTFKALETAAHVDAPLRVRMALLFHDSGKPEVAWQGKDKRLHYYAMPASEQEFRRMNLITIRPVSLEDHEVAGERIWREAAARLNAPVRLREDVATLIRNHMVSLEGKFKASKVRRGRVKFGDDMLRDLYLHRACDISGKGKPNPEHMHRIAVMEEARRDAERSRVPSTAGDLAISGHDAINVGLKGREIGQALTTILLEVAAQPTDRTLSREWQLGRLETMSDG